MSDPELSGDDLRPLHARKGVILEERAAVNEMMRSLRSQQAAAAPSAEPQRGLASRAARDIGQGATEIPRAVSGGVLRAFEQLDQTSRDIAVWAENKTGLKLGGVVFDEDGVRLASSDEVYAKDTEAALQKLIPDITAPQSTTGRMVRGVAQFLTGFVLAGKAKPLAALAKAGKAGAIGSAMAKGALSDFAAMDAQGGGLSQLVERFPALSNPVTRYLAGSPDDTALDQRFKQSLEGLGFGALADGMLYAVRAYRAGRAARAGVEKAGEGIEEALSTAASKAGVQKARIADLIGDPDAPLVRDVLGDVPVEDAAKALANAKGADRDMFVNWSRIDSDQDVKAVIQDMADAFQPGIDAARRGVRTWKQTTIAASRIDAWDMIAKRRVGDALNAEQTTALRELWIRSGDKLSEVSLAASVDGAGVAEKIAFRKMLAVHNVIQEHALGVRAEAARTLNIWRMSAGQLGFINDIDRLTTLANSDTGLQKAAQGIVDLTKVGYDAEADAFIYGLPLATTREQIASLWYASLLSGPHTHARNFIGNLSTALIQVTERRVASALGKVVGDQAVPDGEALALLFGHVQGFKDALRGGSKVAKILAARATGGIDDAGKAILDSGDEIGGAWKTAISGESGFGIGKVEAPTAGAFSPERMGFGKNSPGYAAFFDAIDTMVSMPTRALSTADEVFKTSAFRAEMNAQAMRQASQEVAAGKIAAEAVQDRMAELLASPPDAMRLAAQTYSQVSTFTNAPMPGRAWNAWSSVANMGAFGKLLIPFRRTPWNIATFGFRRTPIAPFMQSWQADVRAGGARSATAWAQFVTGNAILLAMVDLAANGHITGEGAGQGPEQETLKRTGWQPNSVRVPVEGGYRYFSYRGIEPFGTSLGLAANAVEILAHTDFEDENQDADELAIAASMAIASQATSQQYMSGVSQFFDAMSDPRRYGESWVRSLANPAVPTGLAQVARAIDPTMRMAMDVGDSLRARTPGLSRDLPPMRDLWGRPVSRASGLGTTYDLLSPIYSQSQSAEPIDRELVRLEKWIAKPRKRQTFDGVAVDLEAYPQAYDRLVELAGHGIDDPRRGYTGSGGALGELNALVTGKHPMSAVYPLWSDGPDGGRAAFIEKVVNSHVESAREQVLIEFSEVRARVDAGQATKPTKFQLNN